MEEKNKIKILQVLKDKEASEKHSKELGMSVPSDYFKNSKKRIIGGHSSEINGVTTEYLLEETVKINSDGTASKIKTSTLFPETWSDADIINSVKQIGDTPAIGIRMEDKATIHLGRVNNVEIVVIKIGG